MTLQFSIQIWHKSAWFVAECPELDFVAQGRTREEAKSNLLEVLEIQFEEMSEMGTLNDYLEECGYDLTGGIAVSQSELLGFEKLDMQVH